MFFLGITMTQKLEILMFVVLMFIVIANCQRIRNPQLMTDSKGVETTTNSGTSIINFDRRNDQARQAPKKENGRGNTTLLENSPKQARSTKPPRTTKILEREDGKLLNKLITTIDAIGMFGNAFALVIFYRKAMLELPGSLFLRILTATDFTFLLCYLIFLKFKTDHIIMCKIGQFMFTGFMFYSKYILLSFSIERFIAICFPLKYLLISGKPSLALKLYMSILFVVIMALRIPECFLITHRIRKNGSTLCFHYDGHWGADAFVWVDMIMNIIPAVGIIVCNVGVIASVVRSATKTEGVTRLSNQQVMSITAMMLLVSLSYVVLTTPATLIVSGLIVPRLVGMLGVHSNHACNVLLYIISGRIFRQEVKGLCSQVVTNIKRCLRIKATQEEQVESRLTGLTPDSLNRSQEQERNL